MNQRDDGDFSELLTDLSLVGLRSKQADTRILFGVKAKAGIKPRRASVYDGLIDVLNRAIFEKDAKKLSGRQFKRIRERVNKGIRALPIEQLHPNAAG